MLGNASTIRFMTFQRMENRALDTNRLLVRNGRRLMVH